MTNPWMKVAEAVFVAACSAVIFMILIYAVPNCAPIRGYNDVTANKSHAVKNSSDENISITTNNLTTPHTRRDNGIVYYEYADDGGEGHHSNEDGATGHPEGHDQGGHDEQHSLYGFHGSHGYLFKVNY